MNIAIIGYGKMGHIIEQVALQRRHTVVCIIDKDNVSDFHSDAFRAAEVAIEFSTPLTAENNIRAAWKEGIPVVCGTTGWNINKLRQEIYEQQDSCAATTCLLQQNGLLWSSNFSIGVNLFFAINQRLAYLMSNNPQYKPSLTEIHHIHKLDAPSGTAKTIAEQIAFALQCNPDAVPIQSIRKGEVPGTHSVTWNSDDDEIQITHIAHSRKGFATGAVLAAEWMKGKNGYHNFNEVLGL